MFLQLLHLAQAALAGYGAQQSYVAITNLLKYEDASKKAAKISNEAGHQLHKTRTTHTSGAAALTVSLLVSLLLAVRGSSYGFLVRYLASPVMLAAVFFARAHVQEYWAGRDGKTVGVKVPLPKMEGYNEAQAKTEELLKVLGWLVMSWAATSVVALFGGY
ncbi:Uu.00g115530.m01.CDS01 [Anthostomella pinea]|uniref:Uu.00g115530.m01.CDS01 n=1 Tax=Anthostomella pinea TaxID=933095 RepID=A0AAI8VFU3_9PEZI|nr:Uu.00g115530.m01.CDS01 [Anthostomella pinea]